MSIEDLEVTVEHKIMPVIDRYLRSEGKKWGEYILSYASKYDNIKLVNRTLNWMIVRGETPSDDRMVEIIFNLVRNGHVYLARSLIDTLYRRPYRGGGKMDHFEIMDNVGFFLAAVYTYNYHDFIEEYDMGYDSHEFYLKDVLYAAVWAIGEQLELSVAKETLSGFLKFLTKDGERIYEVDTDRIVRAMKNHWPRDEAFVKRILDEINKE